MFLPLMRRCSLFTSLVPLSMLSLTHLFRCFSGFRSGSLVVFHADLSCSPRVLQNQPNPTEPIPQASGLDPSCLLLVLLLVVFFRSDRSSTSK